MIPPLAQRFLAGETPAEAVAHASRLNSDGVGATLKLLGEQYNNRCEVAADTRAYCRPVGDIARADLRAHLSVRPTRLGLEVSGKWFRDHLA